MDALIEIQKIINGLFDKKAEGFKDKDGKHLYYWRAGDAIRFYDEGNHLAGIRLRRAMKHIRAKATEVRMEVSRIKKAEKESQIDNQPETE
jgi:hypothetical protein